MPKVTLNQTTGTNAAVAANLSRIYLEFSANADFRYCIAALYNESDSQMVRCGEHKIFTGTVAQKDFSFSSGLNTVVDVTETT